MGKSVPETAVLLCDQENLKNSLLKLIGQYGLTGFCVLDSHTKKLKMVKDVRINGKKLQLLTDEEI